jgi:hypothetical protein
MQMRTCLIVLASFIGNLAARPLLAGDPSLEATTVAITSNQKTVKWNRPAAQQYNVFSSSIVTGPYSNETRVCFLGPRGRRQTRVISVFPGERHSLSGNALLSAHVLNRLAYGPTPDELDRLAQIGPQQFIDEQMNMADIIRTATLTPLLRRRTG